MLKTFLVIFLVLHMVAISAYPAAGQTIHVITEEYPPYNFTENGEITGVATEVVRAVLEEVGFDADIKSYPWPRAFKMIQENENTMLYSFSRAPDREEMFKWVGVVAPTANYLYALKTRTDITISELDDAKKYLQ